MKEKIKTFLQKNWFKIIVALVILLIGFSILYYFVIFLPQKEEARLEQQRQEQLAKEEKEREELERESQAKEEAEQALSNCIASAENYYIDRWYRECKEQGKLTSKCIDINELSFDEYLEKYGLTIEEYIKERNLTPTDPDSPFSLRLSASWDYIARKNDECSCRLPIATADRFNENLEKDKADCYKRYPIQ